MNVATATDRGRSAWLENRKNYLGGSDIAAVVGQHPHRTARQVWEEKMGLIGEQPLTPPMKRGIYFEDIAVQVYVEKTGRRVRRQPMKVHPEFPFIAGNVDRQILSATDTPTSTLEVKVPGLRVFSEIKRKGLLPYMVLQGQWYALIYRHPRSSFAIFNAERFECLDLDVDADPTLQWQLLEAGRQFWYDHVLTGIPPADAGPVSMDLPDTGGSLVERDDPEWAEAVAALHEARELRVTAEEIEEEAKACVQGLMGAATCVEGAGARIYWNWSKGKTSFDKNLLAIEHPEINLSRYEKRGAPTRSFRPYFLKANEE